MYLEKIYTGPVWSLHGLVVNDVCLVRGFISSLERKHQTKVGSLLKRIGEHGPPTNEEKFRYMGDEIYELKTGSGVRILCFYGGARKSLILTHGFMKAKPKKQKREHAKAVKLYKEYLESTGGKVNN